MKVSDAYISSVSGEMLISGFARRSPSIWITRPRSHAQTRPPCSSVERPSASWPSLISPRIWKIRRHFSEERANGLYGPDPFLTVNFLIGLPYLFLIVILFSVTAYWMLDTWPLPPDSGHSLAFSSSTCWPQNRWWCSSHR